MKKRNVGAGPVSAQKGITLIALIITIVVMLILVNVTVTFTIGENGIFKNTKQAIFKQEISQIKEYVELEKEVARIENKGERPSSYVPADLIANIPDDLRAKYFNEADLSLGKLEVLVDGTLCYNGAYLTDPIQQKWCEDLQIFGNPSFPSYVAALTTKNSNNSYYDETYTYVGATDDIKGKIDLEAVYQDIKEKYPEAVFAYVDIKNRENSPTYIYSSQEYHNIIMNSANEMKTALQIYYEGTLTTICPNNYAEQVVKEDSWAVPNIDFMSYEDSQVFTFADSEYYDYSENGELWKDKKDLKITAYNGTSSNIVVPAFIENAQGEIEKVIEIDTGVFGANDTKPLKVSVWYALSGELISGKKYEEATLDDVVNVINTAFGMDYSERVGEGKDFEDDEYKEELIFDATKTVFSLDDDMSKYFTLEYGNKNEPNKVTNIYMYITESPIAEAPFLINEIIYDDENENIIFTPTIENIEISEGILKVGANAFYPNIIGTIVFPTTIEDVTDALNGLGEGSGYAFTLEKIKTDLTKEEFMQVEGVKDDKLLGFEDTADFLSILETAD